MAQAFERLQRTAFAESGAGETACRILSELLPARGMSISALAVRVGSDRPWVSQVVERLRQEGLVERTQDPEDRRRVSIRLTALGRRRAAQLRISLQEQIARLLSRVPSPARQQIVDALAPLADALEANERRIRAL